MAPFALRRRKMLSARLLLVDRVASGRETYSRMPKDRPHATIAMGRLGSRVREQDFGTHRQKRPF